MMNLCPECDVTYCGDCCPSCGYAEEYWRDENDEQSDE